MIKANDFYLKRLMSITGLLPMGGFLLQHLFGNSFIFVSAEKWNEHAEFLTSLPMVYLIEVGMIGVPILIHAFIGLAIIYTSENNFTSYGKFRNWMYFFQRLTGLAALVFIFTHVATTRLASIFGHYEMTAALMTQKFANPTWFWFYIVGVIAVVFHFCNGIWSFLVTWGITITKNSQKVASAMTVGLFVLMSIWSVFIILKFAQLN